MQDTRNTRAGSVMDPPNPARTPDPDELLSTGQALLIAQCLRSQLDRALAAGELPSIQAGPNNYRFVRRSDLEAWADKRHAGG